MLQRPLRQADFCIIIIWKNQLQFSLMACCIYEPYMSNSCKRTINLFRKFEISTLGFWHASQLWLIGSKCTVQMGRKNTSFGRYCVQVIHGCVEC